jgi:hypothetical protein
MAEIGEKTLYVGLGLERKKNWVFEYLKAPFDTRKAIFQVSENVDVSVVNFQKKKNTESSTILGRPGSPNVY